jgi:hypothetical protein
MELLYPFFWFSIKQQRAILFCIFSKNISIFYLLFFFSCLSCREKKKEKETSQIRGSVSDGEKTSGFRQKSRGVAHLYIHMG